MTRPSRQELLDLAQVLCAPDRCQMLDGDKQLIPDEWWDLEAAVLAAQTGLVPLASPAGDVFVIDFDPTDSGSPPASALARVIDMCRPPGIGFVLAASGRPGHRHLWVCVPDDALREALIRRVHAEGFRPKDVRRGTGGRVKLPGLPYYDTSGEPRLLEPASVVEATTKIRTVRVRASRWTVAELGVKPSRGFFEGTGYASRSEIDVAVCLSAVSEGASFKALQQQYEAHQGAPGTERTRQRGFEVLERDWKAAVERFLDRPPVGDKTEVLERLQGLREAALDAPWPGATGSLDLALYLALVEAGLRHGTLTPAVSRLEMAEALDRGESTVNDALQRLLSRGRVREVKTGNRRERSVWEVLPIHSVDKSSSISLHSIGGCENNYSDLRSLPVASFNHLAFQQGALGSTGWRVLLWLCPCCPRAAIQLSALTGLSESAVFTALHELRKAEIADNPLGDGYVCIPDPSAVLAVVAASTPNLAERMSRRRTRRNVKQAQQDAYRSGEAT